MDRYDELYHYGVKGMKWGVRRYQNADGSLTDAGKKRLTSEITSKKNSTIDAIHITRDAILSDKELSKWRDSDSYKNTVRAKNEYKKSKQKYLDAEDKVWRIVLGDIEKKHGRYEDIVRSGDKDKADKFTKDYNALLDKRFKEKGVYELEKEKNTKYEAYQESRKMFYEDTRRFVENYLGKYGDKPLKGQGSAIRKGSDIVDRVNTTDIFIKSFADIDHISSWDWRW